MPQLPEEMFWRYNTTGPSMKVILNVIFFGILVALLVVVWEKVMDTQKYVIVGGVYEEVE